MVLRVKRTHVIFTTCLCVWEKSWTPVDVCKEGSNKLFLLALMDDVLQLLD